MGGGVMKGLWGRVGPIDDVTTPPPPPGLTCAGGGEWNFLRCPQEGGEGTCGAGPR